MNDIDEIKKKLKAKEDFGWFSMALGIFVLLTALFNSQSFVNYAATLDLSSGGLKIKRFANSWHELMGDIGFTGPRRLIEDLKSYEAEKSQAKTLAK